jgi:hypothetical protein
MFVGNGRAVAEGGMQPRRVVPAFDEAEAGDLRPKLKKRKTPLDGAPGRCSLLPLRFPIPDFLSDIFDGCL